MAEVKSKYQLGDFLKDLNKEKENLLRVDPFSKKDYAPFLVNRNLSNFIDCILFVQEVNKRPKMDKQFHYDYIINSIRPKQRFAKTNKINREDDFYALKEYYGMNNEKTKEILKLLSEEDMNEIKQQLEKGGT